MNWLEVAKRIQLLINNDRYLNAKEKEHYAQWLNEREERQYTEQGLSTSENKDNEKYIYKVGDTVFIGASEYRITAKDDQQVMLSDANAPLFNKQYDIADFEHKIKENALNEHLKVILSEEESKHLLFLKRIQLQKKSLMIKTDIMLMIWMKVTLSK